MITEQKADHQQVWQILEEIPDPEIPVINIVEMGIIRNVDIQNGQLVVTITPTYSGCPAMQAIEEDIEDKLKEKGLKNVSVATRLDPPWTTDWMTDLAREKLREYGIAPPEKTTSDKSELLGEEKSIPCPNCGSEDTSLTSQFGSTPCKALHVCNECREPFDYFKCI